MTLIAWEALAILLVVGAIIALFLWMVASALFPTDDERRDRARPPIDDSEARRAFNERAARELSGRDA